MVRNVMGYIAKEKKLTEIEVKIPFPLSDPEQVLQPLRDAIAANPGIKVASLDHISSYPAALLPIKEMVTLCKVRNSNTSSVHYSLINSAHLTLAS